MKTRNLIIIASVVLLGALSMGACNIPEPAAPCLIGREDFGVPYIVHYTKTSASADCTNYGPASAYFNAIYAPYAGGAGGTDNPYPMDNSYEAWGMAKYGPPNGTVKDIAILPVSLAPTGAYSKATRNTVTNNDPLATHSPYMRGALDAFTVDANGYCSVTTLQPAEQDIGGPGYTAANGPNTTGTGTPIIYNVSNMKFLADAAHQGGQFTATLRYTDGNCTNTYSVIGIHPAVICNVDSDCSAKPNVDAGFGGSGIQADQPVYCNTTDPFLVLWAGNAGPAAGMCVYKGTSFPQLCDNCNNL